MLQQTFFRTHYRGLAMFWDPTRLALSHVQGAHQMREADSCLSNCPLGPKTTMARPDYDGVRPCCAPTTAKAGRCTSTTPSPATPTQGYGRRGILLDPASREPSDTPMAGART